MTDWIDLADELEEWEELGMEPTFWWRDDDAGGPSEALDRLIETMDGEPLGLAVVPHPADGEPVGEALVERLSAPDASAVRVLQHGYRHINHEVPGGRKSEFGFGESEPREQQVILGELRWGRLHLEKLFGEKFLPVLVPPWNRIGNQTRTALTWMGYRGLSTAKPRPRLLAATGVLWCNTHCDPIDWRGSREFVGEETALTQILDHLEARREGDADESEPTGFLTHHLAMDDASWAFAEKLREWVREQPAARFVDPADLFDKPQG